MMSGAEGPPSKICLLKRKRKRVKKKKKKERERTICTDPVILCAFIGEVLETESVS